MEETWYAVEKPKREKAGMESEKPSEEASVVQERLNWQVAGRDDTKVAQALYAGEAIEEIDRKSVV